VISNLLLLLENDALIVKTVHHGHLKCRRTVEAMRGVKNFWDISGVVLCAGKHVVMFAKQSQRNRIDPGRWSTSGSNAASIDLSQLTRCRSAANSTYTFFWPLYLLRRDRYVCIYSYSLKILSL